MWLFFIPPDTSIQARYGDVREAMTDIGDSYAHTCVG